jgi:hypothetical protein
LEEDSSDEGVSDLSSQRNRMGSGGTDLQAAANAYYAGKQTGNNNNKNKNVKK